mmetsp:Transcript_13401/g.49780  ORF Transcript_13401/g.49780 Transcript_13401/m.49780 type:complete len:225 (-) Transcript_13401:127-801(-)
MTLVYVGESVHCDLLVHMQLRGQLLPARTDAAGCPWRLGVAVLAGLPDHVQERFFLHAARRELELLPFQHIHKQAAREQLVLKGKRTGPARIGHERQAAGFQQSVDRHGDLGHVLSDEEDVRTQHEVHRIVLHSAVKVQNLRGEALHAVHLRISQCQIHRVLRRIRRHHAARRPGRYQASESHSSPQFQNLRISHAEILILATAVQQGCQKMAGSPQLLPKLRV